MDRVILVITLFALSIVYAQSCDVTCYQDSDSDTQGNCTVFMTNQCNCTSISGTWVTTCGDCDDSSSLKLNITCYQDYDQDNYGNTSVKTYICGTNPFACYSVTPGHWAGLANDCDDHNQLVQGPRFSCCPDHDCDGVGSGLLVQTCNPCNQLPYPASAVCYDCDDSNPNFISNYCCQDSGNGKGFADSMINTCTSCSVGYVNNCMACNGSSSDSVSCCIDPSGTGHGSAASAVQSCHGCSNLVTGSWLRDCSDRRNCTQFTPTTTGGSHTTLVTPAHSAATIPWHSEAGIPFALITALLFVFLRL